MLLCAWDTLTHGSIDVVYAGDPTDTFLVQAASLLDGSFWPDAFRISRVSGADNTELDKFYSLEAPPQPSVVICHNNACSSPLTTIEALEAHLREIQPC